MREADKIRAGSIVRSHYKASWTGVVVDEEYVKDPRTGKNDHRLVLVEVLADQHGHPLRKKINKVMDPAWLQHIGQETEEMRLARQGRGPVRKFVGGGRFS